MPDPVRATEQATQSILARSKATWNGYADSGTSGKLPIESVSPQAMLAQVPKFPEDLPQQALKTDENESIGEVHISGESRWCTTKGKCDLPPRVISRSLLYGSTKITRCHLDFSHRFKEWPGTTSKQQNNYIAIMVLAWCYIFSSKWIESQRHSKTGARMEFTDSMATTTGDSTLSVEIILDTNDPVELGWWTAIVASGCGWKASNQIGGHQYQSPWSIRLETDIRFMLQTNFIQTSSQQPQNHLPPSSSTAIEYLSKFCAVNDAYEQCLAALAVVLFIPYLGGNRAISLPTPKQAVSPASLNRQKFLLDESARTFSSRQYDMLPYYMSLSSNVMGVRSIFHSSFYNPALVCNLAGPWLQGAFSVIDSAIQGDDFTRLVTIMSKACPQTASLWLAVVILGMEDELLAPIRIGNFAVDLLTGAWLGIETTFLASRAAICDTAVSDGRISRADECRLLVIAEQMHHSRVPICPWEPFGYTDINDLELEVRPHVSCAGSHCLQYVSWHWNIADGTLSEADFGISIKDSLTQPLIIIGEVDQQSEPGIMSKMSEIVSQNATVAIFGWLRVTGYPSSEVYIYRHEWFDAEDTDEEANDDFSGTSNNISLHHYSSKRVF